MPIFRETSLLNIFPLDTHGCVDQIKFLKKLKIFSKKCVKTLDKFLQKYYNIGVERKWRYNKMENKEMIMRVCEITGRVTIVARNLTTAEAMEMVKKLSVDPFYSYTRVIEK